MKKTLLILYGIILTLSVQAAEGTLSNYYFSHISGEQGLSQSNVKAIFQDSYGFMWFGTKNGLNRYDGTSILQLNCYDYEARKGNNNISSVFEDDKRNLWVGTDRGVYRYNPKSDRFTAIDDKTEDGISMENWVANIVKDSIGNIWIVVPNQGVFRYKDETLYHYAVPNKKNFKSEAPNCICVRENGEVWVGTWGVGLFKYNNQTDNFEQYVTDKKGHSLLGQNISFICDYGDWLALAIHEGGVKKYHPQNDILEDINLPGTHDTFILNVMNFDGELWIGTHNEGVFVLNEELNQRVHLEEDLMRSFSLSDKFIATMYRDRQGDIWIGTLFGGVNYLPQRDLLFDKYVPGSSGSSLGTKRVRELVEDPKGNIWIGTEDGGINVLNPANNNIRRIRNGRPGRKSHLVTLGMSIYQDELYCGLFKQGMDVIRLSDEAVRHYTPKDLNIEEGSVYFFYVDSKGYKWVGTGWGLYRANPGASTLKRLEQVGYDWMFDILEEKNGTLWFASMGSGIWKYNPKNDSFKQYPSIEDDERSLGSNSVSSVMQDSRGTIWFSTDRGGICRYNADTDDFTNYGVEEGLPDDVVYKILEDKSHNLWFGTNKGLVKFNPDTGETRVFTTKDGLLGNQFNYKSALKASDGKFYFGSIDGLIAFDPDIAEKTTFVPPIYITKFQVYNQEVTLHTPSSPLKESIIHTCEITLPYDQSNISFDIALLNYSTAESNQYYYMMEPLDRDWIKAISNQNISYAKLPPGKYTFKVKAMHGSSHGDVASRSLSVIILPPWWLSPVAYVFYIIIVFCAMLGWFLWYRRRKEREMEERQKLFEVEKEKELYESKVGFFTEIAHEVRTPLTLINGPLETLREMNIQDTKITRNLKVIGQNTKRLLDLAGQLLDFQKIGVNKFQIKPESIDITALLNETISRFEPTILQKKKELLLDIPDQEILVSVDREAITKIVSNLLNNALKYAQKTITVQLQKNETTFTIRVISDGEKIPLEESHQIFEPFYQREKKDVSVTGVGIGLSLARSLAMLHKGQLYLDDTEHLQNAFVLDIPLNNGNTAPHSSQIPEQYAVALDEQMTPEPEENITGYTVLLVEDDEAMSSFIREKLEESFTVEVACNGKEALDVLKNTQIDIVVSDVMMPVMNGWELCRKIKTDIDISHIPVIFLTAKNDLDSKINGLKMGAEAYVEKPFSFNYLKIQILSLLNNRRKEREAFAKRPFFPVNNMQMNKADEEFMEKVIKVIQENIVDEHFNVERLADILCMSRSSLLRKIKILFNLSPVDFIRLIRLKKAAELIQEGKHRMGDICEMVGINSSSYFSKLFLRQFGMTPKEFEKQNRYTKGNPNG